MIMTYLTGQDTSDLGSNLVCLTFGLCEHYGFAASSIYSQYICQHVTPAVWGDLHCHGPASTARDML
jgi:hypothetical protein